MTTKRQRSQATSREGINFVRALVESQNSTFQEIDLHNDLGNDAYVEFVVKESATGCCVALQIKSGASYRTASGGYAFQADRDHFEYWSSHTLPVLAIIVDPASQTAAWTDISEHLRQRPSLVSDGPFSITAERRFDAASFAQFRAHCLRYTDQYSREPNFGRALESFADLDDNERCYDGLRALFAYHRRQRAMWYYATSCLSNFAGHPVLRALVLRLSHVPGHGDIFWHGENLMDQDVRDDALRFMGTRFDRRDALTLLSVVDENGVQRGSIGQCVHALIDTMPEAGAVMESIASDMSQTERVRHTATILAVTAAQSRSVEDALSVVERLRKGGSFDSELAEVLAWLAEELRQAGFVSLY